MGNMILDGFLILNMGKEGNFLVGYDDDGFGLGCDEDGLLRVILLKKNRIFMEMIIINSGLGNYK